MTDWIILDDQFFCFCFRFRQSVLITLDLKSDGDMRGVGRKGKRSYSCQSDYVELKTPLTTPPILDLHHDEYFFS